MTTRSHLPRVSRHACDRWTERVVNKHAERAERAGHAGRTEPAAISSWQVRSRVEYAQRNAITIPNRYASLWHKRDDPKTRKLLRREGTRYSFYPGAVLVTNSKGSVITVLDASDDDLATMLVWLLMNEWLGEAI
jgi:hypothetical protein